MELYKLSVLLCFCLSVVHATANSNDDDDEFSPESFPDYVEYTKALLLRRHNLLELAESYPCNELDENGEYVADLGNGTGVRICDVCPRFPFVHKLVNTLLNVDPFEIKYDIARAAECFLECVAKNDCLAFTHDRNESRCYLMNNTDGEVMLWDNDFTTGFTQQPISFVNQWFYQRHTQLEGKIFKVVWNTSFYDCIEFCNDRKNCTAANFDLFSKNCSLITGQQMESSFLKYGTMAIFHGDLFRPNEENPSWRFLEDESLEEERMSLNQQFEKIVMSIREKSKSQTGCPSPNATGLYTSFNAGCRAERLAGCDQISGCQTCFYPEILDPESPIVHGLSTCRDSIYGPSYQLRLEQRNKDTQRCLLECINDELCAAIDFHIESYECQKIFINQWHDKSDSHKRLTIAFPKKNASFILTKFRLLPLTELENGLELGVVKFKDCLAFCQQRPDCSKVMFDNGWTNGSNCVVGNFSTSVKILNASQTINSNRLTFVKNPILTSPLFSFQHIFGFAPDLNGTKMEKTKRFNLSDISYYDALLLCMDYCSNCTVVYVSVTVTEESELLLCEGTASQSVIDDMGLIVEPRGNVFIRKSWHKPLTLESANEVALFQENDVSRCLEQRSSTPLQTLSSLGENRYSSQNSQLFHRRHKRGLFDKIGKFFKEKIVKPVVNVVKEVVNEVKDTVVGVGEAVGKVVQGDFNGALEKVSNIPIVKDIKEGVETAVTVVGAAVKGDWNTVKNNLGDLALNAVGMVPLPGAKVVGKIGKKISKSVRKATDKVKKKVKPDADDLISKKKKGKVDKKNERDQKTKSSAESAERCRRAVKRRRPTPGKAKSKCKNKDDDDDDDGKEICKPAKIKNSIKDCPRGRRGARCAHDCQAGYEEEPTTSNCRKHANMFQWHPKPECKLQTCPLTPFPLIPLKVRQRFLHTIFTAYVILFDKNRKLPVWSTQYVDITNQYQAQARTGGFKKHPCVSLQSNQATDADYLKTGYDKGHLTPYRLLQFSKKSSSSSNFYLNIAPQDPATNQQMWKVLEAHVTCFLQDKHAIVATGICQTSKGLTKPMGVSVPSCFWKMLCYRDEGGKTVVIGFYHRNTKVKTDKEKREKYEEIFTAYSQTDILSIIGTQYMAMNPWAMSATHLFTGRAPLALPLNPVECTAALTVKSVEKDAWESALTSKLNKTESKKRKRDKRQAIKRGCHGDKRRQMALLFGLKSLDIEDLIDMPIRETDSEGSNSEENQQAIPNNVVSAKCNKRIIGYFTSWGDQDFTYTRASMLTHVIFAFMEMKDNGHIVIGSPDPTHSTNYNEDKAKSEKRLKQMLNVADAANLKVMFAVGGWENSQYFSKVAVNPSLRLNFISSTIQLIDAHGFDGIDIDWEYPVTGGAIEGIPDDKQNYVLLMKELREALDEHRKVTKVKDPYLISFAGAAGQWTLDPGFDLPGLLKYADWANVMSYDFFGPWESKWGAYTGPPSPLFFGMPPRFSGKTNVDFAMKYYTCRIKDSSKINMGVPFYGRYWENVGDPVDPSDQMWRRADAVGGKFVGGYVKWKDIADGWIERRGLSKFFHDKSKSPYAFNAGSKIFLGYENHESIKHKIKYAAEKNFGGLMIWAVDLDDDEDSMLELLAKADLCNDKSPTDIQ